MHLVLLPHFELVVVKDEKHGLVEVLLEVVLDESFLHRGSPFAPMHLLSLQHLVELLLATSQDQLAEIHLRVIRVVKLFEKLHAQSNVSV